MPVSENPMTPPALKAVLNESVHPVLGLQAPTVQRALEKTATRMPSQPETIEVTAPTMKETPESVPVDHAHSDSDSLAPHAMRTDMAGATTTTKSAHSLYSALRKLLAPSEMSVYSSSRSLFLSAFSLESGLERTSSFTAATCMSR